MSILDYLPGQRDTTKAVGGILVALLTRSLFPIILTAATLVAGFGLLKLGGLNDFPRENSPLSTQALPSAGHPGNSVVSAAKRQGPASPKASTSERLVYPYSVVKGGVYNPEELQRVIAQDPVVATHYADFDLSKAHQLTLNEDMAAYVSYRVHDQVYWTRKKIKLAKGERLVTDETHLARARCGNRISELPQLPTFPGEPNQEVLDTPFSGQAVPALISYLDDPGTGFIQPPAAIGAFGLVPLGFPSVPWAIRGPGTAGYLGGGGALLPPSGGGSRGASEGAGEISTLPAIPGSAIDVTPNGNPPANPGLNSATDPNALAYHWPISSAQDPTIPYAGSETVPLESNPENPVAEVPEPRGFGLVISGLMGYLLVRHRLRTYREIGLS